MRSFWNIHVRYRVARWLIHAGLIVWPDGAARDEVIYLLGAWGRHVKETIRQARGLQ